MNKFVYRRLTLGYFLDSTPHLVFSLQKGSVTGFGRETFCPPWKKLLIQMKPPKKAC